MMMLQTRDWTKERNRVDEKNIMLGNENFVYICFTVIIEIIVCYLYKATLFMPPQGIFCGNLVFIHLH